MVLVWLLCGCCVVAVFVVIGVVVGVVVVADQWAQGEFLALNWLGNSKSQTMSTLSISKERRHSWLNSQLENVGKKRPQLPPMSTRCVGVLSKKKPNHGAPSPDWAKPATPIWGATPSYFLTAQVRIHRCKQCLEKYS